MNYSCLRAEEAGSCGIWNLLLSVLERWGGSEFGLYLVTGFHIKSAVSHPETADSVIL